MKRSEQSTPTQAAYQEAYDLLVELACMPPESTVTDGIRLLAKRGQPNRDWNEALENAARAVQLELRKFYPHDKNAAAAILQLRRT